MEILYTYSYMQSNGDDLLFGGFWGLIGLAILIAIIATRKNNRKSENIGFLILFIGLLLISLSTLIPAIFHPEIEHEVVIKDINQFDTSKYKIIEQKGKIFKVREIR